MKKIKYIYLKLRNISCSFKEYNYKYYKTHTI